ncbi:hypothetical protein [Nitrococcus mobilis]|uniref:hypothetical protein n=1 Tax=Nitrococcus mobilis TaxID=35797 RepID=UPI00031E9573|nr:hypothetical protein [Nitrococcus mobilis]
MGKGAGSVINIAGEAREAPRAVSDPDSPTIVQDTEPNPLQARALKLIRMFPVPRT